MAHPVLGGVDLALPAQVRVQGAAHGRLVVGVDRGEQRGGGITAGGFFIRDGLAVPAPGPGHRVAGHIPVPQAVAGMVQGQLPAAAGIAGHRLGHAQGEGQQLAVRVVYRAHPAIEASARATGQLAGHQAAVGGQQAQVFQQLAVGRHGCRQPMLARGGVGRQRTSGPVQDDQGRCQWVLQQTGDNPLVHAVRLR
ncbi:hypothetical protein D3C72_1423060 [compost metagenome]